MFGREAVDSRQVIEVLEQHKDDALDVLGSARPLRRYLSGTRSSITPSELLECPLS